jgi:excisionase family DNA binding protein
LSGIVAIPPPLEELMEKLYYTPREVAAALAISDDAVLDLINRGDLPALRVSARIIRIPIAAFDLWRTGVTPKRRRVVIGPAVREVAIGAGESPPEGARALHR